MAAGIVTWPMVEFEADDALAAAAALAANDRRVEQVIICTPDKDLSQCVSGTRIVQLDRRKRVTRDESGVIEKFGVTPASIPDISPLWAIPPMAIPVAGMGCQIVGRGASEIYSPRSYPGGLPRVARECRQRKFIGRHATASATPRCCLEGLPPSNRYPSLQ